MPLYEYHCQACGHNFEVLMSLEAADMVSCERCGARATRKLSLFSFKFGSPLTREGEGFSSVHYSPEEYKHRVRNNMGKYDT